MKQDKLLSDISHSKSKIKGVVKIVKARPTRVRKPTSVSVADDSPKKKAAIGPAKPKAPKKSKAESVDLAKYAKAAAEFALEKKATAVKILDLHEITSMTDYFVIATGDSERQVKAIAENVIVRMRDDLGQQPWKSEGWDGLHWIIIDFVDFVVHIFQQEARLFYNLERLWADAPTEEIKDEIKPLAETSKALKGKPKRATKEEPTVKIIKSEFN